MATESGMKVIELKVDNFKRLKAVLIRPGDAPVVEISGRNAQGKSSVIDAIWAALQGASVLKNTPAPVRKGARSAEVRLDLGDYIVTRKFTNGGKNTYLTVTTADGTAKITSPQRLLDSLVGDLSFDPLAFSRLPDREQAEALMKMLKIDIVGLEQQRQQAYNARTIVNRDVARTKAELDSLPVIESTPTRVNVQTLIDEYQKAIDRKNEKQKIDEHLEYVQKNVIEAEGILKRAKEALKEWKEELAQAAAAAAFDFNMG